MIKKAYQKPTMKVVQLQHCQQILTGSPETLSGSKSSSETQDTWYDLQ